jgi:hypothetical protein
VDAEVVPKILPLLGLAISLLWIELRRRRPTR